MTTIAASSSSLLPQEVRALDFCTKRYEYVSYKIPQILKNTTNSLFIHPSPDAFINLSKSKLIVKAQIKKTDGGELDYTADPLSYSQVAPINLSLYSIFKNFSVFAGKNTSKVLYQSNHGMYGLVNYIKQLKKLKYGAVNNRGILFALDAPEGVSINTPAGGGSFGLQTRSLWFKKSNKVVMTGPLNFPAAECSALFPPGLSFQFEWEANSNEANLIIPSQLLGGAKLDQVLEDIHYDLTIHEFEVQLCQVYLEKNPFLAYLELLKEIPFNHFINGHQIKVSTILLFEMVLFAHMLATK